MNPYVLYLSRLFKGPKKRWMLLPIDAGLIALIAGTFIYQSYQIYTMFKAQNDYQYTVKRQTAPEAIIKKQTAIANLHLFGVPPAPPVVAQPKVQWNLIGIILGRSAESTFAIIGTTPDEGNFYRAGDQLPDGSSIAEILPDRVLLSRNASTKDLETLLIFSAGDPQKMDGGIPNIPAPPYESEIPPMNTKEP